ncbi:MAG: thioredoxin [Planctomycetia bacterium]|nr:thioredoxin [Planctomycetia bacterium]
MSNVAQVGSADFSGEVLEYAGVVLVDFFGPGCAPCRALAPTIDKLSAEYQGKAKFVKVDVAQSPDLASKYGIMSVPTILFFKNGEVIQQLMGAQSKAKLQAVLDENL